MNFTKLETNNTGPSIGIDTLSARRQVVYDFLFQGELPYDPLPNEHEIGVSGLWRVYTPKLGGAGLRLQRIQNNVPSIVNEVLMQHDKTSRDIGSQAIFSLIDPERDLAPLSEVTSIVTCLLEKALLRNNNHSITELPQTDSIDTGSDTVRDKRMQRLRGRESIIIEIAAAVLQSADAYLLGKPLHSASADSKVRLAKILANWGPQFVTEWMDGKIITDWLTQHYSQDATKELLELFTPSTRKKSATNNVEDPLASLKLIKYNLEEVLTDENIAQHLGWTEDRVREMFSPSMRKSISLFNPRKPLLAVERIKYNLEEVLTDENIAQHLGWTEDRVRETLNLTMRKHFAIANTNDPLRAVSRYRKSINGLSADYIANYLGWSKDEADKVFTPGIKKLLAIGYAKNSDKGLKRIGNNITVVLSPANIATKLRWSEAELEAIATPSRLKYVAVTNMNDPIDALRRIKHNLDTHLTVTNIANYLGWSEEQVNTHIQPSDRIGIATVGISNPLTALNAHVARLQAAA